MREHVRRDAGLPVSATSRQTHSRAGPIPASGGSLPAPTVNREAQADLAALGHRVPPLSTMLTTACRMRAGSPCTTNGPSLVTSRNRTLSGIVRSRIFTVSSGTAPRSIGRASIGRGG